METCYRVLKVCIISITVMSREAVAEWLVGYSANLRSFHPGCNQVEIFRVAGNKQTVRFPDVYQSTLTSATWVRQSTGA